MPTSSTFIITGNPSGNFNSTLSANGFDKNLNVSIDNNYVRVLTVNEDRTIFYEPLPNNFTTKYDTTYTGSLAHPYTNAIFKLPIPGEFVKIFSAPDGEGTSNSPAQPIPKVYYEPAPLLTWNDVNNNRVLNNTTNERLNANGTNINTNVISYKNTFNGF